MSEATDLRPGGDVAAPATLLVIPGREARSAPGAGSRRWRPGWALWTFLLLVALPTALASLYYGVLASDIYVSEIEFGVRSADAQRNDATGLFQGMPSASLIGLQSHIVVQYIKSREIVDEIGKAIDLRRTYGAPGIDWWARLQPDPTAEDLVAYWRRRVEPYFELTTGIVSVRVMAFSPEDARRIGDEIVRLSESLSDGLSRKARADYVRFARDQVEEAVARLARARQALLDFRDSRSTIDPGKDVDLARGNIARLREELEKARASMQAMRGELAAGSPAMAALKDRVAAIEALLRDARTGLFGTGRPADTSVTQDMRGFEALETERALAEKAYDVALQSLQRAEFEASRKATYLEVFVRPALAEKALYPRRFVSVATVFLAAAGLWIFLLMVYHSVREHV